MILKLVKYALECNIFPSRLSSDEIIWRDLCSQAVQGMMQQPPAIRVS